MTDVRSGDNNAAESDRTPTPITDHIIAFGRVLRRAGFTIGSEQMMDAVRAVDTVGVEQRADVYQALYSVFVRAPGEVELFNQAFRLFWRAPSEMAEALQQMLPSTPGSADDAFRQRIKQALQEPRETPDAPQTTPSDEDADPVELVATYSRDEAFKQKDFADFTAEEVAAAKELIKRMMWPVTPRRTRRRSARGKGRYLDLRRTVRQSLRHQGELLRLQYEGPKRKPRPIVVLCDISGSMEAYARMLLHFMHAVSEGMHRVESFVFGTRLTRITRALERRDIDEALAAVSDEVRDWGGGTRIGAALKAFNYEWLRRTLRSGGVVLIISDGCDRGDTDLLEREMARLQRNCHRLLWLNPLLRYDRYEPLTQGMQAAWPHIDDFLPVHNLEALEQLGEALAGLAHPSSRS